jgi:adenosine deaminase
MNNPDKQNSIDDFIRAMPKAELHVHMEGSIRPETLLALAAKHHVALAGGTVDALRQWYNFTDFGHFITVYKTIANCLRTPDDVELIAREFLANQAAQNIVYSEVTYTPYLQFRNHGLGVVEQLQAIDRARIWAERELQVSMNLIIDIPRQISTEEGLIVADWAIAGMRHGVIGFGLGGLEVGHPAEKHKKAFDRARAAGLRSVPHAGELAGPESIRDAIRLLGAERIGHGITCLRDPDLVVQLRHQQIPLEVCPASNICLKVAASIEAHPLPQLIDSGLFVTINSDDPPLFNTSLTDEYRIAARTFGFHRDQIEKLSFNAVRAAFLPDDKRRALEARFRAGFLSL